MEISIAEEQMTTQEDAIDLCNSDGEDDEDADNSVDSESESSDVSENDSSSNTNNHVSRNGVMVRRPSNVYLVIHNKVPSSSLSPPTITSTTNCVAAVAERQQHTVIVSVHFLLTNAIYAAQDYVREEFGIDADMNDDDGGEDDGGGEDDDDDDMENELDGVDWAEDGWVRFDPTNHLEHRVYVLEKPVS